MTDFLFLTARTGFIAKNRAALVDFFEDDIRATRWYIDPANHDAAIAIVAAFLKMPPERLGWVFTHNDLYRDPALHPDLGGDSEERRHAPGFRFHQGAYRRDPHADLTIVEDAAKRLK